MRRSSVELKHGRIFIFATISYDPPEGTGEFPGYRSSSTGLKVADFPNSFATIPRFALGWTQIIVLAAFSDCRGFQSLGDRHTHRLVLQGARTHSWPTAAWPTWPSSACSVGQALPATCERIGALVGASPPRAPKKELDVETPLASRTLRVSLQTVTCWPPSVAAAWRRSIAASPCWPR